MAFIPYTSICIYSIIHLYIILTCYGNLLHVYFPRNLVYTKVLPVDTSGIFVTILEMAN